MPHCLARLLLRALTTGLAASVVMTVSAARAAEPPAAFPGGPARPQLGYVLDGLEGPDLVTAPGSSTGYVSASPQATVPPSPSAPLLKPQALAMIRLASAAPLLPAPFAPAILSDLVPPLPLPDPAPVPALVPSQGAMPDGSALAAADAELPPLDPAQPAVADALPPRMVLSKLDGPGPLPLPRPVAEMVDPPPDPVAAQPDANDPAPATLSEANAEGTESLTDAIIASLKGNPEIQISLAQQDDARYAVDEARANYLPHVDVSGAWGREFARNIPQAATQRFRSEATVALAANSGTVSSAQLASVLSRVETIDFNASGTDASLTVDASFIQTVAGAGNASHLTVDFNAGDTLQVANGAFYTQSGNDYTFYSDSSLTTTVAQLWVI